MACLLYFHRDHQVYRSSCLFALTFGCAWRSWSPNLSNCLEPFSSESKWWERNCSSFSIAFEVPPFLCSDTPITSHAPRSTRDYSARAKIWFLNSKLKLENPRLMQISDVGEWWCHTPRCLLMLSVCKSNAWRPDQSVLGSYAWYQVDWCRARSGAGSQSSCPKPCSYLEF